MDRLQQIKEFETSGQRPIAGESLTNDPTSPLPFEKATKFTNIHQCTEYLWVKMIEEQAYVKLMTAIDGGVPIMSITKMLVQGGFQEGLWNPDLMILLVEPTAFMLLALTEAAGLEEVIISKGSQDKKLNKENVVGVGLEERKASALLKAMKTGHIPKDMVTPVMQEQLEAADLPEMNQEPNPEEESFLAPPPKNEGVDAGAVPEQGPQQPSLLAPE
tara:strand:- start:242 stop:892 length:651 start_codon:yes stop_codon:yes gene_type:complete